MLKVKELELYSVRNLENFKIDLILRVLKETI